MAIEYTLIADWTENMADIAAVLERDTVFSHVESGPNRLTLLSGTLNATIAPYRTLRRLVIDDTSCSLDARIQILFTLPKDRIADGKRALVMACASLFDVLAGRAALSNLEQNEAPVLVCDDNQLWIDIAEQSDFWDAADAIGNRESLNRPSERARMQLLFD